jgi:hypothetical protein
MDEVRARHPAQHVGLEDTPEAGAQCVNLESIVLGRVAAHELWQVILSELQDDLERLTLRLSISGGLSPRQILKCYPERCANVAQVYRIKRNALERLRRSPRVNAFRGTTPA